MANFCSFSAHPQCWDALEPTNIDSNVFRLHAKHLKADVLPGTFVVVAMKNGIRKS
jgi:hypothetical protein